MHRPSFADSDAAQSSRIASVDLLRGCAILWVLMIHANALPGNPVMEQIFSRAPIYFVILMGVSSELWWRRRPDAGAWQWYLARAKRLLVPAWGALVVWWLLVLLFQPKQYELLSPVLFLQHVCGILIGVGTGWFVTLAVGIALVTPPLHAAAKRFGTPAVFLIGVLITCLAVRYRFQIIYRIGVWGYLVFPLRYLAEVTFGMWLLSRLGRIGVRAAAISLVVTLVLGGLVLAARGAGPVWLADAMRSLDATLWKPSLVAEQLMVLPICVLLLASLSLIRDVPWIARPLAWLGVESYALYLGQMLTHSLLLFWLGFPGQYMRWELYVLALLAGALLWLLVVRLTRQATRSVANA